MKKSMTFEGEDASEQFAGLLNLPNAMTAYEYLQDGERDGIEKWKQFIHVPDLAPEREAKARGQSAGENRNFNVLQRQAF